MAVIGKIRQNVGLLIVVIAIAMLAFLLMDVGSGPGGGAGAQGVVGSVDGQDLSVFRYQEIRDNMMSNQTNMNDDQRLSIREQAWNQYIQEVLAKREYQKLGLSLSETELNDRLTGSNVHPSIRQSFVDENGNFSQDQLKAYVASFSDENVPDRDQRRAQWKRFEQGLMQDILRTKYTNLLSKGVYAPSFFAEANNANQSKKANIKYVQIPYDSVEDSEVGEVTASDINKYVAANKAKYDQDEIRTLNYVSFPIVPTAADTAATKEVITSQMANFAKASDNGSFLRRQNSEDVFQDVYYRTGDPLLSSRIKDTLFNMPVGGLTAMYFEQGAYKVAKLVDKQAIPDSVEYRQIVKRVTSAAQLPVAQSLMDSLKDVVASGQDFNGLAADFSDDPSKGAGGEMGYQKYNQAPQGIRDSLFYVKKQGDMFTALSPQGIHLVQIINSRPTSTGVKVGILSRNVSASKKTRNAMNTTANRFLSKASNLANFKSEAEKAGYKLEVAPSLGKNDYRVGSLGAAEDLVTWAYKGAEGDIAERIFRVEKEVGNQINAEFVVVALADVNSSGLSEATRLSIERAVINERKAKKIMADLGAASSLSATGKEVKTADNLGFTGIIPGVGNEPAVQAAAFGLGAGKVSAPIEGNGGVFLVETVSITEPNPIADMNSAKSQAAQSWRLQATSSALQALSDAAEVEDVRFKTRTF